MTENSLAREVKEFFERKLADEQVVVLDTAVTCIVNSHPDVEGVDARWHQDNSYVAVQKAVTAYNRRVKAAEMDPESEDAQANLFTGFECLQRHYSIGRDEQQVLIAVEAMTMLEHEQKASQMEKQMVGLKRHAQELRRFSIENVKAV